MTDYYMSTGSTGQMLIRDTGTWIEFWINSHNGTTFDHEMPWTSTINGYTYPGYYEYNYNAGAGWRQIVIYNITYSQTVMFKLGPTGTSGLGGPTTFNQFIFRPVVPSSPSTPSIGTVGSTTVAITFTDGADGGAAIDSRKIGYGTNPSAPTAEISSDGSDTVTGLTPGTLYYFWAATHNSVGWSSWSARAQATTLRVPDAPNTPSLSNIRPTTIDVTWSAPYNGGSAITGYEVGFSLTDVNPPDDEEAGTSPHTVEGLTPGETYFFRVRAQNAVGWGPWSSSVSADTTAGAHLKVGDVFLFGIPYVKDAGVWKLAVPYVKDGGVWKETE